MQVHGSSNQVAVGDHAYQLVNVGVGIDQFHELMAGLTEFVASTASPEERLELQQLLDEVAAALAAQLPSQASAHRFGNRLQQLAAKGQTAAVTATVTLALDGLLHMLGRLHP